MRDHTTLLSPLLCLDVEDVVALDENAPRFACQRTPIHGDEEFETVDPFDSEQSAQAACDQLNALVPDELAALPNHLR